MASTDASAPSVAAEVPAVPHLGTEVIHEEQSEAGSEVELVPAPSIVPAAAAGQPGEAPGHEPEDIREAAEAGAVEESATQSALSAVFPDADDIPQGGVGFSDNVVDLQEWRTHILHSEKMINMDSLCWDKNAELGQVRRLRADVVKYYVQRLMAEGEPVKPVDVFTKMLPSVSLLDNCEHDRTGLIPQMVF